MKTYKIHIEETIVDTFEVEAIDKDEAIELAAKKYKTGEFVLEAGNMVSKQMSIAEDNNEDLVWFDF